MKKMAKIIVFEGIAGSGKTTQAEFLKNYLSKKGYKVLLTTLIPKKSIGWMRIERAIALKRQTNNDGLISFFPIIQTSSLERKNKKISALIQKYALKHFRKVMSLRENYDFIIYDRYFYSTLVYQLNPQEWIDYSKKFIKPDLAILFDLPADRAYFRTLKKEKNKIKNVYETKEALILARKKYLGVWKKFKLKKINALDKKNKIFKKVLKIFHKELGF